MGEEEEEDVTGGGIRHANPQDRTGGKPKLDVSASGALMETATAMLDIHVPSLLRMRPFSTPTFGQNREQVRVRHDDREGMTGSPLLLHVWDVQVPDLSPCLRCADSVRSVHALLRQAEVPLSGEACQRSHRAGLP